MLCRCLQSVNLTRSPLTQFKMFVQLSWTLQFSAFCFVFRGVLASPPTTTMTPRWRQSTWTRSWTSWPNAGWNRSAARWTARISTAPFRALSTRSSLEQYEKLAYTSCSQTRAQFAPFVYVKLCSSKAAGLVYASLLCCRSSRGTWPACPPWWPLNIWASCVRIRIRSALCQLDSRMHKVTNVAFNQR